LAAQPFQAQIAKLGAKTMRQIPISTAAFYAFVVGLTVPLIAQPANQAPGPCEQIVAACKSAGFVEGDYKKGYGLHVDCIDPIMRGTGQPAKADKPLPSVSPELVVACKAKHPNFGQEKQPMPKKS
jgi:hypothetical protein